MPHVDEITGGSFGVDKNKVPVGFHWHVLRKFTDDAGNVLGEARVQVPLSAEELQAHISGALTARDADIAADRAEQDALKAEIQKRDLALDAVQRALAPHMKAPAE